MNDGSGEVARDLVAERHGEVANAEWIMAGVIARNLPERMDVSSGDAVTCGPVQLGFPEGRMVGWPS